MILFEILLICCCYKGRRKVWSIHELLAETEHIEPQAAKNIVQLFENDNTIPFICRYRKDLINHIIPEKLRDIKSTYTEIVDLRKKATAIVEQLQENNVITEDMGTEMLCAKTKEELEFLVSINSTNFIDETNFHKPFICILVCTF